MKPRRKYELRRRADRRRETRARIVEATVALHTSVGPARTTISAIAERAGVQRHTVYAHFPDDRSLFHACSMHWREQNPFPDPSPWAAIADPEKRLGRALAAVYGWYARVEREVALFRRDADLLPVQAEIVAETDARLRAIADLLARGFPRRRRVRAAIGHALEFETWRSLARRHGLGDQQAVDVMLRLVAAEASD